ncbi:MAG: metalloregulator ArsR/SmtB family transcription factor [Tepidiformaceae bacterium]
MKAIDDLDDSEQRAANVFRALGNPARVRIVRELSRSNVCLTSDLVHVLPLAQSTVSQHLKVLKEAGIVQSTMEGDPRYCLNPETVRWLAMFCTDICCPTEVSSAGDACCSDDSCTAACDTVVLAPALA